MKPATSSAIPVQAQGPGMNTLKYSDLSPDHIAVLRILATLEDVYPETITAGVRRPSTVLAGWAVWKAKKAA